jgi:hypothetical protein
MQACITMHLPTLAWMQIPIPTPMILTMPPRNPKIPMQEQQTTTRGT